MKKKTLITIATVSVLGLGLVSAQSALANGAPEDRPMANLAQKIAEKFNLNQDEVQSVFDETRQEHQAEMEATREERQTERKADLETRLSEAVSNGEITQEQKALILAKHEELQAQHEERAQNMGEMSEEDRQAGKERMEQERAELEAWAEQNGIDMKYLMGAGDGMGMRGPGGQGGPRGPIGERPADK